MTADDRKRTILELLKTNGSVRVNELSSLFSISEVSIRNDLADMENKGLLTRVHGGAVSSYKPYYNMSLNQRMSTNQIEKEIIARKIADMIVNNGLSDCVFMRGSMSPDKVRAYMEQSEIYLFTSDRQEGWGAVLNESMNSACAVVANSAIGSVPFLIKHGENGYMYQDGGVDALYANAKMLLDHAEDRKRVAKNAYLTMVEEWNAENAAEKFVILCEKMLAGEYKPFPYDSGICSKAEILK